MVLGVSLDLLETCDVLGVFDELMDALDEGNLEGRAQVTSMGGKKNVT